MKNKNEQKQSVSKIDSWKAAINSRFGSYTDYSYDSRKDSWELGDEPMTQSQRQQNDDWNRECRLNGW